MTSSVRVRVRLTDVNRHAWINLGLFTAGLVLAFIAQRGIYDSGEWLPGAILYTGAFVLLVAGYFRLEREQHSPYKAGLASRSPLVEVPVKPAHPARKLFVLPSILFAFLSFIELGSNEFTFLGTTAWLTALALFLIAFWEGSLLETAANLWRALRRQSVWVILALVGIIALGAFFYLYRLDAIPAEMTSDHAEKILDTWDILNGARPIFFERNTGREPLQFYFNALVVALGITPLDMIALKVVGACAGILTIPAVFLLGREMFDDEVGLLAAFFFAVSIFPLAIARIGLRYPLSPLFVAWTCFFLVRALRAQSRNAFLMAGLMMGLGLNGYSPFRVVVPLAFVWMVIWFLLNLNVPDRKLPRFAVNGVLMYSVAALVFLPLLKYISGNPGMFAYRMATRLTSLEVPVPGNPILTFIQNNWNALWMFNVQGDVVWVNAVPNVPVVDWVIGACFLIGAVYGVYWLVRFLDYPFALIFAAGFILLLPSTLAVAFPEENPSVVRAGGIAPFIMLLAAIPLVLWRRQFVRVGARTLGDVALGVVLLTTVLFNYNLYFYRYDEQFRSAAWNSTEIAATLGDFARAHNDREHIYIVSAPYWVDHRAVGIHLGNFDFNSHLIEKPDVLREQATDPAPKLYAVKPTDLDSQLLLKELYPSGVERRVVSRTKGRDFLVFYTEP